MADLNLRAILRFVDHFSGSLKKVLRASKSVSPLPAAVGLTSLASSLSNGVRNLVSRVLGVDTQTLEAFLETVAGSVQGAQAAFQLVDDFAGEIATSGSPAEGSRRSDRQEGKW